MRLALGRGLVGGLEETAQEADLPSEGRTQPALPHPPHWDGLLRPTPEARGACPWCRPPTSFTPWWKISTVMGPIARANVLSDLYTMGITECDNMFLLLCQRMPEEEPEKITPLMIKGFQDAAEEGGTAVTDGQTVVLSSVELPLGMSTK